VSADTRTVIWPAETEGASPTTFDVPVVLKEAVQFRDAPHARWKESHSDLSFSERARINKIVGYEKYRTIRVFA
jgi:hypothetical protein